MDTFSSSYGKGRTRIDLMAYRMGTDLVVSLANAHAHIGAVAVGDYDHTTGRTSCSLVTRLGHKEGDVAQKAAYAISKHTQKPTCVIAGIHLDNVTQEEIREIIANAERLVERFIDDGACVVDKTSGSTL
jgi:gallate decarboxylase subunit D